MQSRVSPHCGVLRYINCAAELLLLAVLIGENYFVLLSFITRLSMPQKVTLFLIQNNESLIPLFFKTPKCQGEGMPGSEFTS